MMPKMPHVTWEFILENNEDIKKLADKNFIENFVIEFCKEFELTVLEPRLNYQFKGEKPEENGITAFYILSESGIHIQTWPEYRYGFVDVFSCKHFNEKIATRFIRRHFGKGSYHYDIVWRGTIFNWQTKEKDLLLDTKNIIRNINDKESKESIIREKRIRIDRYKLKE
ncbi:MAG: S-adenosylmethionine decarboxylase [Candidatus Micrarchaeota archaeon]|nr:S-adenosylmethionine decarboxylase [Candidatus Micrarchaeota archaeon]